MQLRRTSGSGSGHNTMAASTSATPPASSSSSSSIEEESHHLVSSTSFMSLQSHPPNEKDLFGHDVDPPSSSSSLLLVNDRSIVSSLSNSSSSSKLVFTTLEILLVIGCVVSMVIQTEVAASLQRKLNYSKPYFILWTSHVSFLFLLPFQLAYVKWFHGPLRPHFHTMYRILKTSFPRSTSTFHFLVQVYGMMCLGTLAAYLWYCGLNYLPVGQLTTLYNLSPFFAYFMSLWLTTSGSSSRSTTYVVAPTPAKKYSSFSLLHPHRSPHFLTLVALLITFLGVSCITLLQPSSITSTTPRVPPFKEHPVGGGQEMNPSTTMWTSWTLGVSLGLLNAVVFGGYEAMYKHYLAPQPSNLFFSNYVTVLLGAFNLIGCWPPMLVFHLYEIETFQWPTLLQGYGILGIAVLGLIFNMCFLLLIAITTPVWAASAIVLTIPCSTLADYFLGNIETISWNSYVGTFLICIGFYLLTSTRIMKK